MARNLLPRLKQAPNPANIPQAKIAEWTAIQTPADLAKLDFGIQRDDDVRTRIQSIPSPWARMLLFRTALEDKEHPAYRLVTNELLDAFQFLWSANERPNALPTYRTIRLGELQGHAEQVGTERASWLARALVELLPRRDGTPSARTMESITVVTVGGQPILASSPYTVLFTAENAAHAPESLTDRFFRYAVGGEALTLASRPFAFQQYVAQVLLPQLEAQQQLQHADTEAQSVQRLVRSWLQEEVQKCRSSLQTAQQAALAAPSTGWQAAAEMLGLVPLSHITGGLRLYARRAGAEMQESRWLLRPSRAGVAHPPLVLDQSMFDGQYAPGASAVSLPKDVRTLDRTTLPGTATHYPWTSPKDDWFVDRILLLAEPQERGSVYGFSNYRSQYQGPNSALKEPQMALPLKREVLSYFTPEEIDKRLTIQVHPNGQIEVTLRIPLGPEGEDTPVTRLYDASSIRAGIDGPSLTLWPRFRSDRWRDYTLFRHDSNPQVGAYINVVATVAGEVVEQTRERRNEGAQVIALLCAPDALEFESLITGGGTSSRLGLVMPRYDSARSTVQERWNVGVDFGTSNTVVSLRTSGASSPEIFSVESLTLPLTKADADSLALLDAYFLPHTLESRPFGSAVVHFHQLPTLNLHHEAIGVRINVPFNGNVEPDDQNRVFGDLKWSTDQQQLFLSASFLRHLMAVILAQAVQRGVDPANVSITWAHPRAFTPAQVNQVRQLWTQVQDYFTARLGRVGPMSEALDESAAVLRFFFNDASVTAGGDVNVVVDVGGGTSDIAIYGHGAALALDSIALGGRHLTGQRQWAGVADRQRNPFVRQFATWARQHQLGDYPREARAVEKYLEDGQEHLAFTYLMRSEWFRQQGQPFSGDPSCHRFQALVLYFFGSLFYYVGLSLRSLSGGDVRRFAPATMMLAGNGSQYVHWLTDLTRAPLGDFAGAFGRLLLAGLGAEDGIRPPTIQLTSNPKLEVALGLVASVTPQGVASERTQKLPVAGERFSGRLGERKGHREFDSTTRLAVDDLLAPQDVASLTWLDGELEIQRYNRTFLDVAQSLTAHGQHWNRSVQDVRAYLTGLERRDIEQVTRAQLQLSASATSGFGGSLFILEATTMLGLMMDRFFSVPSYTPSATDGATAGRGA